jgi:hypothetical protein
MQDIESGGLNNIKINSKLLKVSFINNGFGVI